jgi:hypothetical protein
MIDDPAWERYRRVLDELRKAWDRFIGLPKNHPDKKAA